MGRIPVDESELEFKAIRSPGPGGQNVNKVASAVQLRFDVRRSASLPVEVRERLEAIAGNRVTRAGVLIITAHRLRTREANKRDALQRLQRLIERATERPKTRRQTRRPPGAERRRLEDKRRRGVLKESRRTPPES